MSASLCLPTQGRGVHRGMARGAARLAERLQRHVRVRFNHGCFVSRRSAVRLANRVAWCGPRRIEVELDAPKIGLFAQINACVQLAAAAEACGRPIHFTCTSANYSPDGRDWLPSVLVQRAGARASLPWLRLRLADLDEYPFPRDPALTLTLPKARRLFRRLFAFAPEVLTAAERTQAAWPAADTMVGVHYRGTDKSCEAERVDAATVVDTLQELAGGLREIDPWKPVSFYVATDESRFVDFMRERFGPERVQLNPRSERSGESRPVHLSPAASFERARDAVVDMLLLSRCSILVRTSSFLSGWAAVLARQQQVLALNEPFPGYAWFPDREIARIAWRSGELDRLVERFSIDRCCPAGIGPG